ncbi:hypothetical protein AGLY_008921 [Aphis glycines]|uniref:Uncharacterized protein n=1 Tax=Aphis glycines TaxID=307491 RepID=A0A6G0TLB5_APHGL|nr:hypothetical protein AGLY_008921 [Aphis glycines]
MFDSVDIIDYCEYGIFIPSNRCGAVTFILILGVSNNILCPLTKLVDFIMSEPLVVVELKKLTPAEITKFTSKKQKKQRKYKPNKKLRIEKNISVQKQESSVKSNEVIPSEMTIEQTVDENNGMDESVPKQDSSVESDEDIPNEMTIEQTVDENNGMDESVPKQDSSVESDEDIPNEMTIEQTVDENNGMDESVPKQDSLVESDEDIPNEMTIEQTVDENNGMDESVPKQDSSVESDEDIPNEMTIEQTVDENNGMDENVQKQVSSVESDEAIPNEMTIEQTVENNEMESIESVQREETSIHPNKLISCVNIKQEMHNNDYMMDNGTQSMDNMPNVSNDFDPNIVIKQEVEDEDHGYATNYNDVEEEDDNMFDDSSNNFIPGIFNREMQNDNMGNYMHITAQGNMFGQSNNFIPNFNYGHGHNVVNMRMVLPHYMYNTNGEILPVAFHNNDNEWINHAQGHMYDPSNHLIPNIIHRPGCFHNNDYVGNNMYVNIEI